MHRVYEPPTLERHLRAHRALLRLATLEGPIDPEMLLRQAAQLAAELAAADVCWLHPRRTVHTDEAPECRCLLAEALPIVGEAPEAENGHPARPLTPAELAQAMDPYTVTPYPEDPRYLVVPLTRMDRVLAVSVLFRRGSEFTPEEMDLVGELSLHLSSVLQSQHLFAARSTLIELAQHLTSELHLTPLLETIVRAAATMVDAQASSILLIQPDGTTMRFAAVHGLNEMDRERLRSLVVPLHGSMAGSVALTGKALVSNDVARDPRFYAGVSDSLELKTRSLLAVPLVAQDRPIGALEVINHKYGDGFRPDDVDVLTLFATQAAIAIQNARLLAEREERLNQIRQLEQRKSQFIALASHELRTPLNLVSGYAALMRSYLEEMALPSEHPVMDSLGYLEHATARLIEMVGNITSLHNLETGATQLLIDRNDLVPIMRSAAADYRGWCRRKGLELQLQVPDHPVHAMCDSLETNRILHCLLSNAVKFTPEGGRIVLAATPLPDPAEGDGAPPQEVLVSVADTGPGIPPDRLDAIFERFAQLDDHLRRAQGGIGLGLPLAKGLVEKHGGRLWVESTVGVGSTFYFTLPAG